MIVADRAGVLSCFDETANPVFAALCHLTAGDVDLALDLTVDTYAYLSRMADGGRVDVDRRWIVAAAHSVYAAGSHRTGSVEPMAALAPLERVALSLQQTEHWELEDVAALAGVTVGVAAEAAASAERALGSTSAEAACRVCEVWFDDQMRANVRVALANGTTRERLSRTMPPAAVTPKSSVAAFPFTKGDTALDSEEMTRRPRRSRRLTIVALVGSVAVIGALALWVRPSGDVKQTETIPTAAPSTSGRPPETTTPFTFPPFVPTDPGSTADTTGLPSFSTIPAPLTGFITSAPPPGFQASGGYADGRNSVTRRNWFELWSGDDATRTNGRWFGLIVVDEDITLRGPAPASDAQRLDVVGRPALVRSAPDGVLTLVIQLPGRQHVELRSNGFSAEQLASLVAALQTDRNNQPSFAPVAAPLFAGLSLRNSEPTNEDSLNAQGFSHLQTSAFYISSDARRTITINSGVQRPNDLLASRLLNPPPTGPPGFYAPDGRLVLDSTERVAGTIIDADTDPGIDPYSFVQWHLDGSTVTVMGDVPAEQLFEVARQVRRATEDEWVSQSRAVPVFTPTDAPNGVGRASARVQISSTVTNAGPTWTLSVDHSVVPGTRTFSLFLSERRAGSVVNGTTTYEESETRFAVEANADQPVREYDAIDATIVVVLLTSPPEGAKIRVTLSGADPMQDGQILPLVPLGGEVGDVWAASYAFSEQSAYTVDLMEVNGSTVIKTLLP